MGLGSGIPDPGVKKAPDPGSGSVTLAKYKIPEVGRGEGQLLYVLHPRPGPAQAVHAGLHGRQLVSRHQNNHLQTIYDKEDNSKRYELSKNSYSGIFSTLQVNPCNYPLPIWQRGEGGDVASCSVVEP